MFYRLKIQKSVDYKYLLCNTVLRFKTNKRKNKFDWLTYDNKLDNSISRAKSNIFNIATFNKFEYFFTQTINNNYDRSDLNKLVQNFSQITRNLRKTYHDNFYYLIIPELHSDGKNWHLHGFLSLAYGLDSYINKNGFISIFSLDKIGYNSITKIKNYNACVKYMTEYITKDLAKNRKKGDRLYYCSKGLKRENVVNDLVISQLAPIHFDFKCEHCFKSTITQNQYFKLINDLDNETRLHFYNYN